MISLKYNGRLAVYGWPLSVDRAEAIVHVSVNSGSVGTSFNLTIEQAGDLIERLNGAMVDARAVENA